MSDKVIHLVFQVMNYLRSKESLYNPILPIDKLLLIFLAGHNGDFGIFPNQETLANELHVSLRYIKERIKFLQSIGLISIERKRRKNYYTLTFLSPLGEPQITNTYQQAKSIGELQITSQVNHRSPHRGTTVHTNRTSNNKINKTERERTNRARPLSDDFLPNEESSKHAWEIGLTEDEANFEFEKFMNYYLDNGAKRADWQRTLRIWFDKAVEYKKKARSKKKEDEPRSTVDWYHEKDRRGDPQAIGKLLSNLKQQADYHINGGSTNGLGSSKEGEGEGN